MSFDLRVKNILDVGSAVLVSLAAGALLWTFFRSPTAARKASTGPRVESVNGLQIDGRRVTKRLGSGPVVLVEFTDFQCPFCAKHARDTYPEIRRDFIDQNKITYVSFSFPLDRIHPEARRLVRPPNALRAKVATGRCTSASLSIRHC